MKRYIKSIFLPLCIWAVRYVQRHPALKSFILNWLHQFPLLMRLAYRLVALVHFSSVMPAHSAKLPVSTITSASVRLVYSHLVQLDQRKQL